LQDSTTLAIANIGANLASSVIVRIPEQKNFQVTGATATIIGNLDAGDYTLATFELFQTSLGNSPAGNSSNGPNAWNNPNGPASGVNRSSMTVKNNLTVEISYTDTLGIRRSVVKSVSFDFINSTVSTTRFSSTGQRSTTALSNGLLYIIIGSVGIVIVVIVIKIRSRKKK
jgi:hypothetical protein